MKLINQHKPNIFAKALFSITVMAIILSGCKKELPEAGSIADLTPPSASFGFSQISPDNFLEVTFSNTSVSATDYFWDLGDGTTSTALEPVHTYPEEGVYTVTLTATDKLDVSSTVEMEITLTEPAFFIPPILESSFEDGQLEGGEGDGRDSWRNSDLGGVIQITDDPVASGNQAAKLTGDPSDQRIGYQLITVSANATYDLFFEYTMLSDPDGFLTVSILDGPVTSHEEALAATIGSVTVNDQSNPDFYTNGIVTFNSGNNTEVAIYFFNEGSVETRLDDFSIDISTSTVPPSAAFTYQINPDDYQEVSFTNNSINAVNYSWDFGDGNISDEEEPTHNYMDEGTYTVILIATSSEGENSQVGMEVEIAVPSSIVITNPSLDDFEVNNDNREAWRNSTLESDADDFFNFNGSWVLQMSSTARTGNWSGKLPTAENSDNPQRWMYQAITVDPNTDYLISAWIRNKDAGVGSTVTFTIYDAPFNNASTIENTGSIITSADFDESTGHDTNEWTEATIEFNSGSSSEVVLFITNDYTLNGDPDTEESESFLDDFSITEQ
ncbi:MAG: PKD domain-containing protein [Flavobacteriales bacterium]